MFPFRDSDDLWSQMFSNPYQDQITNQQDQIMGEIAVLESQDLTNNTAQTQNQNQNIVDVTPACSDPSANDNVNKKIVHRETERQRRKQQATLFASLRSLLPIEYIKGKRSITDQISEAARYIKHLNKNIKEMNAKREKLKRLSSSSSVNNNIGNSKTCSKKYCFTISQSMGQVEVTFSSGFDNENLQLSRVLELVIEEGLDVVSCVSTKVDGSLLHAIQSKVNDLTCFNVSSLKEKLGNYCHDLPI
ncbi:transcription factor bHLH36-like [Actinidia eriantha]|uniref:transcription factor bHLH36-like n=1 Tax=Actinidia eriantha TaxID=165200 RepID=UPI002587825A|nr:transcription factor bHLH36-like [Actinidia eriantha]